MDPFFTADAFLIYFIDAEGESRFELEDATGWQKLMQTGALPATAASILFEWLIDSRHDDFKAIHGLVV